MGGKGEVRGEKGWEESGGDIYAYIQAHEQTFRHTHDIHEYIHVHTYVHAYMHADVHMGGGMSGEGGGEGGELERRAARLNGAGVADNGGGEGGGDTVVVAVVAGQRGRQDEERPARQVEVGGLLPRGRLRRVPLQLTHEHVPHTHQRLHRTGPDLGSIPLLLLVTLGIATIHQAGTRGRGAMLNDIAGDEQGSPAAAEHGAGSCGVRLVPTRTHLTRMGGGLATPGIDDGQKEVGDGIEMDEGGGDAGGGRAPPEHTAEHGGSSVLLPIPTPLLGLTLLL